MDFSKLETKTGAEKGAFLHLRHPASGELLYDTSVEPKSKIGLFVRGTESKTVQDRLKGLQREQVKGADAEDSGLEFVSSLVIRFVGVERDGRLLSAIDEDLRFFFGLSDSFVEQVIDFAKARSNFFGHPLTDSYSPPVKSAS